MSQDELPSNVVYDIYRDKSGFLWFGTDRGITRYNGLKFETFTTFDGLPDNEIFFSQEDGYGRLWIATYSGDLCYYENNTFHTAANTPFLNTGLNASHIRQITPEADSSVTIFFFDQQSLINIHGNKVSCYNLKDYNMPPGYLNIHKLDGHRYKLIYERHSIIIDTNGNVLNKIKNSVRYLKYSICQGRQFLYTGNKIFSFSNKPLHTLPSLTGKQIEKTYTDGNNYFYCTVNGLYINDTIHLLKENNISAITRDIDGNYWIATLNNGAFKMPGNFKDIEKRTSFYNGQALHSSVADDYLFFATSENKLYKHQHGQPAVTLYKSSLQSFFYLDDFGDYHIFSPYRKSLLYTSITNPAGRAKYAQLYLNTNYQFVKQVVRASDILFIRFPDEIIYAHLHGSERGRFRKLPVLEKGQRIFSMSSDSENNLWFSTINHVYKTPNLKPVLQKNLKNVSFRWFDLYGKSLVGCTHANQLLIYYTTAHRIADTVKGENCIWSSAYSLGENKILLTTNRFYRLLTLYPAADSFSLTVVENPFIPIAAESVCADNKYCLFFKDGNVTKVRRENLTGARHAPVPVFTFLKTQNKTYNNIGENLKLSFAESRQISIRFTVLSFGSKQVEYYASISKDGKEYWKTIKSEEINLYAPEYGEYTIKIAAQSLSSKMSTPLVISFSILKPFWLRGWFITIVCIISACVIFLFTRWMILRKLRQRNREHEAKIKFLRSEYTALNALMNPHFIFNSLNSIQGLINTNNRQLANEYLTTFSGLIRKNMDNLSHELIPLQDELKLVDSYLKLEQLRFKGGLEYTIEVADNVEPELTEIPPLLIQPLVENSVKHGLQLRENNLISVKVVKQDDKLVIEVRDNGIGFTRSSQQQNKNHRSYGLQGIRQRIEKLGIMHDLEITFHINDTTGDNVPSGTTATIVFSLPD